MDFKRLRMFGRCVWEVLKRLLSPTFALAHCHKNAVKNKEESRKAVGALIRTYHKWYLGIASLLALACTLLSVGGYGPDNRSGYYASLAVLVWIYSISRANEIMYAFVGDAIARVNDIEAGSDLTYGDRIRLALSSYLELVVNFASVYYVMPADWFNKSLETYWQALYFSGVTITTLGYGDFSPKFGIAQFLSVYEVFCGFALLIVSITAYVSGGTSETSRGKNGGAAGSVDWDSQANGEPSGPS